MFLAEGSANYHGCGVHIRQYMGGSTFAVVLKPAGGLERLFPWSSGGRLAGLLVIFLAVVLVLVLYDGSTLDPNL